MDYLLEIFAWIGFGSAVGTLAIAYSAIHSTIAGPPPYGARLIEHFKVYLVRFVFAGIALLSFTILRPLRLAFETHNFMAPITGLIVLFAIMIFGMRYVVPKFMKITLTTTDLMST